MGHTLRDSLGGTGGQRAGRVGVTQIDHSGQQFRKLVTVERLGRLAREIRVVQEGLYDALLRGARKRQRAALIQGLAAPRQHQIVDRRIRGTGIKSKTGVWRSGALMRGSTHVTLPHAPEV